MINNIVFSHSLYEISNLIFIVSFLSVVFDYLLFIMVYKLFSYYGLHFYSVSANIRNHF
ncbi:Uncharacterised protein [Yersinia thracica]|uniref:Uncharacterized protein n=1 Tax=Yersinia thracica TaxID=2890319 RepID=A0A0T9P794_9GAMM|nr:Uncharacterised protein [Yersinia thracica]